MFCKNCGNQMDPVAGFCISCGAAKGMGSNYCANCGSPANPGAAVCLRCGCILSGSGTGGEQKSKLTAGLLAILLGAFGAHNFYLGRTGRGIAQLALSFCFGIGWVWSIIEGIMIFTGSINTDAKGIPLRD